MRAKSGRSPLPVSRTPTFTRQLSALTRKHRQLERSVDRHPAELAANGTVGVQLPSVDGHSVFKVRLPLDGRGKRGGARMICAIVSGRAWGLFVYERSSRDAVPTKALLTAIRGIPNPSA